MAFETNPHGSDPREPKNTPSVALLDAMLQSTSENAPAVFEQMVAELGPVQAREQALSFCSSDTDGEAWKTVLRRWEERRAHERAAPAAAQPSERHSWTWEEPDLSLIPDDTETALEFPVDIFGTSWAEWCRATAHHRRTSVNFVAGTLLATAGGLLGNARWPQARDGWKHPSVVWVALLGNSSAAKTPGMVPVEDLIGIIYERRVAAHAAMAAERLRDAVVAEIAQKRYVRDLTAKIDAHVKEHGSFPTDLPLRPPQAEPPKELIAPSLYFDRTTVEAISAHMAGMPKGALLKSNELSAWFGNFDRYAQGNGDSDQAFWIEAFDGRPHKIGRKGQDLRGIVREQTTIPRLSIGVLGGTQPSKIRGYLTRNGSEGDTGLAHRFIWVWGDPAKPLDAAAPAVAAPADDAMALKALTALDQLKMAEGDKPVYVRATPDAARELDAYSQKIALECAGEAPWRSSSLGKAPGIVLRVSCILTHLRWSAAQDGPEPTEISLEVMHDAIRFVHDYCMPNAKRLQRIVASGDAEGDASGLLGLIREHKWPRFNITDVKRHARQRLRETNRREDALDILELAGLIKPDPKREGETKGRPRRDFVVNPLVHQAAAVQSGTG